MNVATVDYCGDNVDVVGYLCLRAFNKPEMIRKLFASWMKVSNDQRGDGYVYR